MLSFFFFNDTATTEIYTLSLHDALPICICQRAGGCRAWSLAPACRRHPGGEHHPEHPHPEISGWRRCAEQRQRQRQLHGQIGRAHVLNPVTPIIRMSASACKKKTVILLK